MKTWQTTIEENPETGEAIIILPEEVIAAMKLSEGDELIVEMDEDIVFISKKEPVKLQMTTEQIDQQRRAISELRHFSSQLTFQCRENLGRRCQEVADELEQDLNTYLERHKI